jgi:hypothetical protein
VSAFCRFAFANGRFRKLRWADFYGLSATVPRSDVTNFERPLACSQSAISVIPRVQSASGGGRDAALTWSARNEVDNRYFAYWDGRACGSSFLVPDQVLLWRRLRAGHPQSSS